MPLASRGEKPGMLLTFHTVSSTASREARSSGQPLKAGAPFPALAASRPSLNSLGGRASVGQRVPPKVSCGCTGCERLLWRGRTRVVLSHGGFGAGLLSASVWSVFISQPA